MLDVPISFHTQHLFPFSRMFMFFKCLSWLVVGDFPLPLVTNLESMLLKKKLRMFTIYKFKYH